MQLIRLTREDNSDVYVAPHHVTVLVEAQHGLVAVSFTNNVTLFVRGPLSRVLKALADDESEL